MKNIYRLICAVIFGLTLILAGCADSLENIDLPSTENGFQKSIPTRCPEEMRDSVDSLESIIPVSDSPYKRVDGKARYGSENSAFFDIREMDVNIMVRENTYSKSRYLSSNGLNREVSLTETAGRANQKFKLYIMPLTGYIYIKDYQNHLVSMGVYTNAPDTRVLYVKDGDSTSGACWDFYKGIQREYSNILENADALTQGPGGWMDVYNEVLGVKNSKLYFGKYNNSATQEFEIRVVESLKIINNPTYSFSTAQIEEKPNYILRGSVTNNTSRATSMTVTYAESANVTSSFQENKSYTTNISGNTGISTPIFSLGGSASSSSSYGFTYSQGESKNIAATFNQSVEVAPYSKVQVIAIIRNYEITCNYEMTVEGIDSGRRFIISGVWQGISCVDVDYQISEISLKSGEITKTALFHVLPGENLNLSQDDLKMNCR